MERPSEAFKPTTYIYHLNNFIIIRIAIVRGRTSKLVKLKCNQRQRKWGLSSFTLHRHFGKGSSAVLGMYNEEYCSTFTMFYQALPCQSRLPAISWHLIRFLWEELQFGGQECRKSASAHRAPLHMSSVSRKSLIYEWIAHIFFSVKIVDVMSTLRASYCTNELKDLLSDMSGSSVSFPLVSRTFVAFIEAIESSALK